MHARGEIAAITAELADLAPAIGAQWLALAKIAVDNGSIATARVMLQHYVEQAGDTPQVRYQEAGLWAHLGDWARAHTILSKIDEARIDPAALAHSRGTAALYLGLMEDARWQLEKATQLAPWSGASWHALAMLVNFAAEPGLAARIVQAGRDQTFASPADQSAYLNALGKAQHDLGDHAAAFAAFASAARLMNDSLGYDPARDRLQAEAATSDYSTQRIAAIASQQTQASRSIFVTGLPRSGTTLVEQILTSHSTVADGSELNLLGLLTKEIGAPNHDALAAWLERTDAPAAARLWNGWLAERYPQPGAIVDKTTNSSRMLGLAATLLPDAPLVWLVRDPIDCAWSCYRTYFSTAQPWSNSQADIAQHFRIEDALRARWQDLLGDRLLVMAYEDLGSDPQAMIPQLLAHCGLTPEPQVFAPHTNTRAVTTSSAMQVRQPISRMGIGAAAPYREFLDPFMQTYYG